MTTNDNVWVGWVYCDGCKEDIGRPCVKTIFIKYYGRKNNPTGRDIEEYAKTKFRDNILTFESRCVIDNTKKTWHLIDFADIPKLFTNKNNASSFGIHNMESKKESKPKNRFADIDVV